MSREHFMKGLRDGIPIACGYFAVSFAFGIPAVESGCTVGEAVLISFTNLTSAGQFAGLTVIAQAGTLLEVAVTQLVINSRYMLMAVSLSQKVDEKFRGIWRWILGYGITDEIFATAIQSEEPVSRSYFGGLLILPVTGWSGGTFFGAFLGNILPEILTDALGVALYGMFIAVFVPKSVEDRRVLAVVILAIAISLLLYYVPVFSGLSAGFSIILCAVVASAVGAVFFPVKEEA
ncbi:MAG: AzlC family ABC transporter permease [Clostridiales bacterium]|nr:AzlC family ABC transporter permease [Clostridiales bacterium]